MTAGIRDLKDNLSHYLRQVEKGKRVSVTLHGRVVAELVPPQGDQAPNRRSRYDELVASGAIRPPLEDGDPFGGEDWAAIPLKSGTWLQELDESRKDFDEE
jgi:prevent-host-death family protein